MTMTSDDQIKVFFKKYADNFNSALNGGIADVEGTAQSFSSCVLAANPFGVICGSNGEQLKSKMAEGYAFYNRIGVTAMNLVSIETTSLDDIHQMSKIKWQCLFTRKDDSSGNIDFTNIYFTQLLENEIKIFAFITGDEKKALKENGVI